MFRWILVCLLLAGSVVGVFALVMSEYSPLNTDGFGLGTTEKDGSTQKIEDKKDTLASPSMDGPAEVKVIDSGVVPLGGNSRLVVIPSARLSASQRQNVPSERDGKLIVVGTELKDADREELHRLARRLAPQKTFQTHTEVVEFLREKEHLPHWYVTTRMGFLAVALEPGERVPPREQIRFPGDDRVFRRWRKTDKIDPTKVHVAEEKKEFRSLSVGDTVEQGELVALVNPALVLDELFIQVRKLEAAYADHLASEKTRDEAAKRYDRLAKARRQFRSSVSDEELGIAKLGHERYRHEAVAKASAIRQTEREVNKALTTLDMYEIHSAVPGVVRVIYKYRGEAIKSLETILELQNTQLVRVEGMVEVQNAQRLLDAMHKARLEKRHLEVVVEPSRPVAPVQALKGHVDPVTCVAISKGPNPIIVSGSKDHTVRLWKRLSGQRAYVECCQINHHAVVRAVACTSPKAERNLLLTGTDTGVGRVFDLDKPEQEEGRWELSEKHSGPIHCVAFNPKGTLCATAGRDRSICLWKAETGERVHRFSGAHKASVTTLHFADDQTLVSASEDRTAKVWKVKEVTNPDSASVETVLSFTKEFPGRSGDVPRLGVSKDGKYLVVERNRALLLHNLHNLEDYRPVASLHKPASAENFTTLALFSPDGRTLLTNSESPGHVQLWRMPEPGEHRAAELRQFTWSKGEATCGAFAHDGSFVVTGTEDRHVLLWDMPSKEEVTRILKARLTSIARFQENSEAKVPIRAELSNPGWLLPGSTATIVINP